MPVGEKMSYVIVGGSVLLFFCTPRTAFRAFSETDFWIYSVALYCK
jgi:hypothetical protein